MPLNIAIDGPVGAGKSSIASAVAKKLDILHLDTGAMYRTVGLAAIRHGVSLDDEAAVTAMADAVYEKYGVCHYLINGAGDAIQDTGDAIGDAARKAGDALK